jgi:hypothetical protein
MAEKLTLRQVQWEWLKAFSRLIQFAEKSGWELTPGDLTITPKGPDGKGRRARLVSTGELVRVEDAVHMRGGTHYSMCGGDVNLFVDGQWISKDHPVWHLLGEHWVTLHSLARWGGHFGDGDWNHFSVEWAGKK